MAFSTRADVYAYPEAGRADPVFNRDDEFFPRSRRDFGGHAQQHRGRGDHAGCSRPRLPAPAGYAISRYFFAGAMPSGLSILAVRAFPIVILAVPLAVTFIEWGMYDQVYSVALMHTALTLPTTILVDLERVCQHPARIRRSGAGLWLQPAAGVLRVVSAAGDARASPPRRSSPL